MSVSALSQITHIWFDLEGTLAAKSAAYEKAAIEFVYTLYAEVTKRQITKELKEECDALLKKYKRKGAVFAAIGKAPTFFAKVFAKRFPFEKYFAEDKDVKEVISFLKKKKIKLGVYTSLPKEALTTILRLIGLDPRDSMFLTGNDVKQQKPHQEGFKKIIACSRVPVNNIIFVGDSEYKDIVPAKSVGMKTILVYGSSTLADYAAADFKDLLSFFQKHL